MKRDTINIIIAQINEIIEANKGKKQIFYSTKALNPYGNQTSIEHRIKKINERLAEKKLKYRLSPHDKIKIIIKIK